MRWRTSPGRLPPATSERLIARHKFTSAPLPMARARFKPTEIIQRTIDPMKKQSILRLLFLIAPMLLCAATARAQSVVANLPESDAVVTINARRIVGETLPRLLSAEQMAGVQAALAKAKQVAGFDMANVESAVIGLRLN